MILRQAIIQNVLQNQTKKIVNKTKHNKSDYKENDKEVYFEIS